MMVDPSRTLVCVPLKLVITHLLAGQRKDRILEDLLTD